MSSRERWTVYPLLFLTLGIALTDKVTRRVDTDTVVCKSLLVTDKLQRTQVVVGSNEAGGIVQTQSAKQRSNVIVGHLGSLAGLFFNDSSGRLRASLAVMQTAPPAERKPAEPAAPAAKSPAPKSAPEAQK